MDASRSLDALARRTAGPGLPPEESTEPFGPPPPEVEAEPGASPADQGGAPPEAPQGREVEPAPEL